jgi:hypothetical protein
MKQKLYTLEEVKQYCYHAAYACLKEYLVLTNQKTKCDKWQQYWEAMSLIAARDYADKIGKEC